MKRKVFIGIHVAASLLMIVFVPGLASAGFMDKINSATQKLQQASDKLNQKTQQTEQKAPQKQQAQTEEDPDRPLHLEDHYKGSCEGKRSATCMDYMELVDQCMDPLKGYRMKVTGDLIEKKLKTEKQLTDKQRKNLEQDLAGIREAEKNKSDNPTIAGEKNSQRHLQDISEEDQVYINAEYNTFYKKIYNKCMGADHMGTGKRTEMMQDVETMSGEQAVAELKKKKAAEDAPFECLKNVSNVRWIVMAEMMEQKMAKLNPAGKEKEEWEADIASVRKTAETTGAAMPVPADPKNPTRYMMRLSPEEQVAMMEEYSKRSQEESARCSAMAGDGKIKEKPIKSGGLVDRSKSPANKNATPVKKAAGQKKGIYVKQSNALSCSLGACGNLDGLSEMTDCQDEIGGYRWRVIANKLEAKMAKQTNLSGKDRSAWEADIAAVREAEQQRLAKVNSPDPDNEFRYMDRLTRDEQGSINQEYLKLYNARMKYCNENVSTMSDHN